MKSIPRTKPLQPIGEKDRLFSPELPGGAIERFLVEQGMILKGSQEGGFFIVIGRRPTAEQAS